MKYTYIIPLISLFFLYSCSNSKRQKSINILQHQTIDLGINLIGYGGFLAFYQDAVIGLDFASPMPPFFCFKPNESSQMFFHFGNKGQGPDDFLMPLSIQYINNNTVGTFDVMSKTYSEFSIPAKNEVLRINRKIRFQAPLTQLIKTAFNQYIGLLAINNEMFLLTDSSGIPIKSFFEYPYRNNDERRFEKRSVAYQGTLAANPSKNKFIYSCFKGEIIHFYEIEDGNIKKINIIENEYPIYRDASEANNTSVAYGAQGVDGYVATYATEKFVYAIYSGRKILERVNNRIVNLEGTWLRIFDWDGILVKEYELDVPCSYLCISDDDSKIWAIASIPEITIVSFDLENESEHETEKRWGLLESKLINGEIYFPIDNNKVHNHEELKKIIMNKIIKIIKDNSLSININDIIDIQIDTLESDNGKTISAPIILKNKEN